MNSNGKEDEEFRTKSVTKTKSWWNSLDSFFVSVLELIEGQLSWMSPCSRNRPSISPLLFTNLSTEKSSLLSNSNSSKSTNSSSITAPFLATAAAVASDESPSNISLARRFFRWLAKWLQKGMGKQGTTAGYSN